MNRILPLLPALLASACFRPQILTEFEGGSLGAVERRSDTEFVCAVEGQADQDGRNRQASWYYFRLDNARGRDVTVTLTDLVGEYNFKPARPCITDESPPVYSYDGVTWTHLKEVEFDRDQMRVHLRLRPEARRMWVAHLEPYTASRLERFLREIDGHPFSTRETIGTTVRGRDLHLLTITNPDVSEKGKKVVWLMIRQHAWESGSSFLGEGAIRWMLSDDEEARHYRDRVVFKVFPMMDPDGCAEGGVRFNRHGYDLNRNWDAVNITSSRDRGRMPEILAAKKAMFRWLQSGRAIDLFLTVHNQERGEWVSGSGVAPDLAESFFALLHETATFHPGASGPRAPRKNPPPGRMTVYEFLERGYGVPALILEQGIARHPELGRVPTSKDRAAFGRGVAQALCRAVLEN